MSGYVIVIVAGWTTANANLYRAGLAAQAIFHKYSRKKVTFTVGIATVVIACFLFVFRQILPLLTYAGLLVVPVGGIVFAEHVIFPRIGFTRYCATYRKLKHSTPAVAAWAAGLIFGFGLNALQVMSFFYLFLPTWAFTIALYTLLASLYGARKTYPVEQAEEEELNAAIKEFQMQQASKEADPVQDNSKLSAALKIIAWAVLALTLVMAIFVMFGSPDMYAYQRNTAIFYPWSFAFTIAYFVASYWALRRSTSQHSS